MILAMDPGFSAANATGAAIFNPLIGKLVAATVIRRNKALEGLEAQRDLARRVVNWAYQCSPSLRLLNALATEWPQIYPNERQKDPNTSLLPLCGIIGAVVGMLADNVQVHAYLPRQWKGTIKGDAFLGRIVDRLDSRERQILEGVLPAGLRHNATDAVGIGLHFLGRLGRTRAVHND